LESIKDQPDNILFFEFTDEDEWQAWTERNDPVLHIELKKISSYLLIAPLSANTMGKIANGLCDNLLTSIVRCWDLKKPKSVLVAPAMNTFMYEHPLTEIQEKVLRDTLGFIIIPTIFKILMCGDEGMGAMADVNTILNEVFKCI
jgi:phosphopantothenoylcysteine decarboxylase